MYQGESEREGKRKRRKKDTVNIVSRPGYKGSDGIYAWGYHQVDTPANAKGSPKAWGSLIANTPEEKGSSTISRSEQGNAKAQQMA